VSEQILNGTSAQLSYTVQFMSVHAGKYGKRGCHETMHRATTCDTAPKLYMLGF